MKILDKKSEKYLKVSKTILEIIEREGVEKLSHSQIARLSGVSRAWIYEYMGADRNELINIASDFFANYFSNSDSNFEIKTKEDFMFRLKDGQELVFQKVAEDPIGVKLYYRFRGSQTPMGETIFKYEAIWMDFMIDHMVKVLKMDKEQAKILAETVFVTRLGFAHRIATSVEPQKEMKVATRSLDDIYELMFKTNNR